MKKIIIVSVLLIIQFKGLCQNKAQDSNNIQFLDSLKKFKIESAFYESGKIKTEKSYYCDKMVRIIYFSEDGKLLVESNYNFEGEEYGWQKEYYGTGKLKKEIFIYSYTIIEEKYQNEYFNLKVFNGPYSEYYENGVLKKEGCSVNGKNAGLYREYDSDGKIKKMEYYDSH